MKMQSFQFFNIAPYSPGAEKELAADMVEYQKRTGNDVVLYLYILNFVMVSIDTAFYFRNKKLDQKRAQSPK